MIGALNVIGWGAVTPVGLNAPQTCAAIRAKISGLEEVSYVPPDYDPVLGGVVPARLSLKESPYSWLASLAVRAIRECLQVEQPDPRQTALLLSIPDRHREHPAFTDFGKDSLLEAVQARLGQTFHPSSRYMDEGHASVASAVEIALDLFRNQELRHCVIAGVDSMLNRSDIERLSMEGRLHGEGVPQGVIPGEGATAILVVPQGISRNGKILTKIAGSSAAIENDTVFGKRTSVGNGLVKALTNAVENASFSESDIVFRVSDMNGERYRGIESMYAGTRFYRTIREHLSVWYPAMSVGDLGAAAGPLLIIVAGMAMIKGYAPGTLAMCELSSESGLRGACLVSDG